MYDYQKHLNMLIERYPALVQQRHSIERAYFAIEECYRNGGKLLIAGNGGSAADAEHMVGELMKTLVLRRKIDAGFANELRKINAELGEVLAENLYGALPAIALTGHYSLTTACINDGEPLLCFAQQVNG